MSHQTNSNLPQRPRTKTRTTTRLSPRQRLLLVGGAVSTLVILLMVLFYNTMKTTPGKAAVTNDFRSKTSGNWSTTSTWERYDGTNWVNATTAPTFGSNEITIQTGHIVSITSNVTADQLIVSAGGRLNINSSQTLTLANGSGTDLVNNGIVSNTGTITLNSGAAIAHTAGAEFIHARNAGTIPNATWDATSTCTITGVTSTIPSGFTQNYGNLKWNCAGQFSGIPLGSSLSVQKNFEVVNTGSQFIYQANNANRTLTIGGDYIQSGGVFYGSYGTGSINMNITGNFQITGGEYYLSWYTGPGTLNISGNYNQSGGDFYGSDWSGAATVTVSGDFNLSGSNTTYCNITSGTGVCTFNVNSNVTITGGSIWVTEDAANGIMNIAKNFTFTGGYITENSSAFTGNINFNGTTTQLCEATATTYNSVNYTVNSGATLQMNTASSFLNGGGTFTLSNNATLGIKSSEGISSSGASGHIQVTGSRTFNTGAGFIFNGTSAQISGSGLPATVRNLSINNASGVTLSNSVNTTDILTMSAGNITTGGNTLTLGTGITSTGTLVRTSGVVVGNFRRWVASATASNILFPVGTSSADNTFDISFTAAPTGGTINSRFDTGFPGVYGLPISDAGDQCSTVGSGWWTLTGSNGFNGGTMTIAARAAGFTGINDYTTLHLFRRDNDASVWDANGTHQTSTGSLSVPFLNRSGVTQLGQFGMTSSSSNPLPVQLIKFDAKPSGENALVTWSTATETNNDYFIVQHSANGRDYTDVKKVDGSGNSNTVKSYSCTHTQPVNGINYYRLLQVDMNGDNEIFGPKTVNFRKENKATAFTNLTAAPNPFSSNLSLQFESAYQGSAPLRIFSAAGKEVFSGNIDVETGNNNIYLPLADQLNPGSYIIVVGDGKDASRVRVVKQ